MLRRRLLIVKEIHIEKIMTLYACRNKEILIYTRDKIVKFMRLTSYTYILKPCI